MSSRMCVMYMYAWTNGFFLPVQIFPQRRVFYVLGRIFLLRVPVVPSKLCMYVYRLCPLSMCDVLCTCVSMSEAMCDVLCICKLSVSCAQHLHAPNVEIVESGWG